MELTFWTVRTVSVFSHHSSQVKLDTLLREERQFRPQMYSACRSIENREREDLMNSRPTVKVGEENISP